VNPDAVNQVRAAFTKLPVAGRVSSATADRKLMGAHPVIPDTTSGGRDALGLMAAIDLK
jgi:hypothetical protein